MRILITGGTGLIGSYLIPLLNEQHDILVYTRNVAMAERLLTTKVGFTSTLDDCPDLDAFDAVINLAGEPIVAKRWSKKQKHKIEHSRWDLTDALVQKMLAGTSPPAVFISGSAIGYYGRQDDTLVNEDFSTPFDEFSHRLCRVWEEKALAVQSDNTRVCLLRTGIVLSKKGGALDKMLPPFKLGLGGPIGKGNQYMSWIHMADMLSAIQHVLDNDKCHGAFNLTAPNPASNTVFSQELANTLNKPCFVKTPAFVMKLMLGEMSDLLVYGQRVYPQKLLDSGFEFQFPELEGALSNLLS